jgi:hypothetical protein
MYSDSLNSGAGLFSGLLTKGPLTIRWIAIGIEKVYLLSGFVNINKAPMTIGGPRIDEENNINAINKLIRYIVIEDNGKWPISYFWQDAFYISAS